MPTSYAPDLDDAHVRFDLSGADLPRDLSAGQARENWHKLAKSLRHFKAHVEDLAQLGRLDIARSMAGMFVDGYATMATNSISLLDHGISEGYILPGLRGYLQNLQTPSRVMELLDGADLTHEQVYEHWSEEVDAVVKTVGVQRLNNFHRSLHRDLWDVSRLYRHRLLFNRFVDDALSRTANFPPAYSPFPTRRAAEESEAERDSGRVSEEQKQRVLARVAGRDSPTTDGRSNKSEPESCKRAPDEDSPTVKSESKSDKSRASSRDSRAPPRAATGPDSAQLGHSRCNPIHLGTPDRASMAAVKDELEEDLRDHVREQFNSLRGQLNDVLRQASDKQAAAAGANSDVLREIVAAIRTPASAPPAPARDSSSAPYESWMSASKVKGVTLAGTPSATSAWNRRAPADATPAELKVHLHRLVNTYPAGDLLKGVPNPDESDLWVELRSTLLETLYTFKHCVSTASDTDRDLLDSLIKCAQSRVASGEKRYKHRWLPLTKAQSVAEFVSLLDHLYMNAADNAREKQWTTASEEATSARDLFHRLQPLLTDHGSLQRGKEMLINRLGELGPVGIPSIGMLSTSGDTLEALKDWEAALAFAETASSLVTKNAAKAVVDRPPGARRSGLHALSEGAGETRVAGRGDLNPLVNGQPRPSTMPFHADIDTHTQLSEQEAAMVQQVLYSLRASQQGAQVAPPPPFGQLTLGGAGPDALQPDEASLLLKVRQALREERTAGPSSQQPPTAAPFAGLMALQKDFKIIYDLRKVYAFCDIPASDIPEAKPGSGAANGGCKICVLAGQKIIPYDNALRGNLPKGTRFDHNPWKCPCISAVVKGAALAKKATSAEVEEVLAPLPFAPWKSQGE